VVDQIWSRREVGAIGVDLEEVEEVDLEDEVEVGSDKIAEASPSPPSPPLAHLVC
jgi:hypothetical protein